MNKLIMGTLALVIVASALSLHSVPAYAYSSNITEWNITIDGTMYTEEEYAAHQQQQQNILRRAIDCPAPPAGGYRFVTYIPKTEEARLRKAKYMIVSDVGLTGEQIVSDLNSKYTGLFTLISHRQPRWGFTWVRYNGIALSGGGPGTAA